MSATIKLSELLASAIDALHVRDGESRESWRQYGGAENWDHERETSSLRAIAPALVELVAADCACEAIADPDDTEIEVLEALNQRLINASTALRDALKEAGVTCD